MSDTPHDPRLNALEAALSALQPTPARLDRDRLLYEAGRHSVRFSWFWRCSTALSTLTALLLGVLLYLQPGTQVQYVYLPAPPVSPPPPPENMVHHPLAPPVPPLAQEAEPRSWLPFLRPWPQPKERSLEDLLALPSRPRTVEAGPVQPLREWLGLSWVEWKQLHFLGKPSVPIVGGGF